MPDLGISRTLTSYFPSNTVTYSFLFNSVFSSSYILLPLLFSSLILFEFGFYPFLKIFESDYPRPSLQLRRHEPRSKGFPLQALYLFLTSSLVVLPEAMSQKWYKLKGNRTTTIIIPKIVIIQHGKFTNIG